MKNVLYIAVIISLLSQPYLVPYGIVMKDDKESNEPDYDEGGDQLEEEQEEETAEMTIKQVF